MESSTVSEDDVSGPDIADAKRHGGKDSQ